MNSTVLGNDFLSLTKTGRAIARSRVDPLNPVRQWRIHIGAHKTATTHLQHTLAAIRPRLVARGVDSIPLPVVRSGGLAQALIARRPSMHMPVLRGMVARHLVRAIIDPFRQGPQTVILSEEKLLGSPRKVFSEPLYPMVEHIIPRLASLGDAAEVTLFLSIRGFHTHLPSTYAQELRVLPPPEGGFDAIKARVLSRPPSWFDLVRRIRAAAPGTPLRIWCQEDYRDNAEAILSALAGCDIGALPDMSDPISTRSPSLEAIREAESLPSSLSSTERRILVDEIFASAGQGTKFSPFSKEETALFQSAYKADLARIADLGPDVLIRC